MSKEKIVKPVEASKISSNDRQRFFKVHRIPFETAAAEFKKIDSQLCRVALRDVVNAYISFMNDSEDDDEKRVVQPRIKEWFWPKVCEALNSNGMLQEFLRLIDMVHERSYAYNEENEDAILALVGIMDHALQVKDSEFCCLTLEDKSIRRTMLSGPTAKPCTEPVAQAFSQIRSEVATIKSGIPDYVPQEYVGLLQNGIDWIGVFQKLVNGITYYTYTVASNPSDIVSLLEHALCTAAIITREIIFPDQRPKRRFLSTLPSIADDEEGDSDDQEDYDNCKKDHPNPDQSHNSLPPPPGKSFSKLSAKEGSGSRSYGKQKSYDLNNCNTEYYVLPLTKANLASFTIVN